MKYFVIMIDKNQRKFYKKNKCVDGWSTDPSECWAFSENGARGVCVSLYNSDNSHGENVYDFVPSYGKGKNE